MTGNNKSELNHSDLQTTRVRKDESDVISHGPNGKQLDESFF